MVNVSPVYHVELLFVPEFHTGTYQYTLYQFIFFFICLRYILVWLLRRTSAPLNFHFEQ
jgi:hypothetical protein